MRKPALCKMLKHRLGEYLSEKCVHTHVVRKLRPFIYQKLGHSFTFFFKKRGYYIPGSAEKGGSSARTPVLCHIRGSSNK